MHSFTCSSIDELLSRKVQHYIFIKDKSDYPNKYQSDIIRMVKFLIDNI